MNEKELEASFYVNYRKWEQMFKEHVADKTDRQMTIMEPVFFSWDKDIDIHAPLYDSLSETKIEEGCE